MDIWTDRADVDLPVALLREFLRANARILKELSDPRSRPVFVALIDQMVKDMLNEPIIYTSVISYENAGMQREFATAFIPLDQGHQSPASSFYDVYLCAWFHAPSNRLYPTLIVNDVKTRVRPSQYDHIGVAVMLALKYLADRTGLAVVYENFTNLESTMFHTPPMPYIDYGLEKEQEHWNDRTVMRLTSPGSKTIFIGLNLTADNGVSRFITLTSLSDSIKFFTDNGFVLHRASGRTDPYSGASQSVSYSMWYFPPRPHLFNDDPLLLAAVPR